VKSTSQVSKPYLPPQRIVTYGSLAYVGLSKRYLRVLIPPLIIEPDACPQLSVTALRRNLEAHAACNSDIVTAGTHQEMVLRLTEILKIRKLDALVMTMLEEDSN
jgi:hypothetical protein